MATRQTAGKAGKRATTSTARKPAPRKPRAGGTSSPAKAARTAAGSSAAKPGRAGRAAADSAAKPAGGTAGASASPPRRALAGLGAAWRAAVRWAGGGVSFTALVVSVLGLADAAYLTYQHFTESASFAGCSEHGGINCVAVTTSAWSHLWVFPVSVLGLAFFAFMVAVNSRWGWRAPWPAVHWARLGSVVVGIVLVLYLIWAELFRINAICLYCTGVHVLTFILFALIVGRATFSGLRAVPDSD